MNLRRTGVFVCVCCVVCARANFLGGFTAKAAGDTISWGYSLNNLDKTCKPCDDFYQFAMGGWMKSNPVPPEYPTWGTFTELRDKNLTAMRTILDSAAKSSPPQVRTTKDRRLLCNLHGHHRDRRGETEAAGAGARAIDAIQSTADLQVAIANEQREDINSVFEFGSTSDFKDSTKMIAEADQGGLGMPDRDYYVRDDEHSKTCAKII